MRISSPDYDENKNQQTYLFGQKSSGEATKSWFFDDYNGVFFGFRGSADETRIYSISAVVYTLGCAEEYQSTEFTTEDEKTLMSGDIT